MDSPISLDDFKAVVGKTGANGSCHLKLHLLLIRIVEARHGSAFPTHMGKLTKVQLTTGLLPKGVGKQAAPNMVKIGTRLFSSKTRLTFGASCHMGTDAGCSLINCIPDGGTL